MKFAVFNNQLPIIIKEEGDSRIYEFSQTIDVVYHNAPNSSNFHSGSCPPDIPFCDVCPIYKYCEAGEKGNFKALLSEPVDSLEELEEKYPEAFI